MKKIACIIIALALLAGIISFPPPARAEDPVQPEDTILGTVIAEVAEVWEEPSADSAVLADVPLEPRVSVGEFTDAYGNTYLYVLNRDIDGPYNRGGVPESEADGAVTAVRTVTIPLREKFRIYQVQSDNGRQTDPWEDDAIRVPLAPGCAGLFRIQNRAEPAFTLEYRIEK